MISRPKLRNFDEDMGEVQAFGAKIETFTKDEVDALVKSAHEQGHQAGFLMGADAGRAEMRRSFQSIQVETVDALTQELARLAVKAEEHRAALLAQVVGFTLQSCEVVFPELIERLSAARVKKVAHHSLKMAIGSSRIHIRLSPATMSSLEADLRARAIYYKCDHALDLQPDPSMRDGEARMEWDRGALEYGFEQICNRLLTELREAHKKAIHAQKETIGNDKI